MLSVVPLFRKQSRSNKLLEEFAALRNERRENGDHLHFHQKITLSKYRDKQGTRRNTLCCCTSLYSTSQTLHFYKVKARPPPANTLPPPVTDALWRWRGGVFRCPRAPTDEPSLPIAGTAKLLNQAFPPRPGLQRAPPRASQPPPPGGCVEAGLGAHSLDYGDGFTVHTRQNSSMTVKYAQLIITPQ